MAKTESITMLIEAENKASAELRRVQLDTKKTVSEIKEFGGQAKASSEMVGALANSVGAMPFGDVAGQVAMLTERTSAFSEVMNAGGKGALAFKGGLVALAGVVGFQVGKAIGDVIWQTEEWTKKLEEAEQAARQLNQQALRIFISNIEKAPDAIKQVNRELAELGDRLNLEQQELAIRRQGSLWDAVLGVASKLPGMQSQLVAGKEQEIEATKEQLKQANELRQKLIESANAREREAKLAGEAAIRDQQRNEMQKSISVVEQLRLQKALALADTEEKRLHIQLRAQGVRMQELDDAIKLSMQIKKIADDEKRREELKKQAVEEQKKQLKELIDADKKRVSEIEKQIKDLDKTMPSLEFGAQAQDIRGLTGNRSTFRKTVAEIEAEKTNKKLADQEKLQQEMVRLLARIEQKESAFELLGP